MAHEAAWTKNGAARGVPPQVARAVAALGLAALVLMTMVAPGAALACAGLLAVAVVAFRAGWRSVVVGGALGGAAALALAAALAPGATIAVAATAGAGLAAWGLVRDRRLRTSLRSVWLNAELRIAASALGAAACIVGAAVYPVTTAVSAIVAGIVALAWFRPAWALAVAIVMFGVEGSLKLLLGLEPTPLPGSGRAVGAAAIDVGLAAAVAGVLFADRLRTPRELWARASPAERLLLALLGWWLAVSLLQILPTGDPAQGLDGFRLLHAYLAVGVAAAIVVARPAAARAAVPAILAAAGLIAAYAALRVVIGPAEAEINAAREAGGTFAYGRTLRAVGSFSGAVGLTSFLTPAVVFALVIGLLDQRWRRPALGVAALGLVGIVGSYGRGPLVAIAVGLLFAVALTLSASTVSRRRKLVSAAIAATVLVATYSAAIIASQTSPQLGERASGILNPLGDESVQLRLERWWDVATEVRENPLGTGLGTIGGATGRGSGETVTADNSFLKVLREQGVPMALLWVALLLGLVVVAAARLRRLDRASLPLGLASLAGFVAFLVLATTGEYVEQPGKVVAWALLGIAVSQALLAGRAAPSARTGEAGL